MRLTIGVVAGAIIATGSRLGYLGYLRDDISAVHDRVTTGSKIAQTRCGPIEYAVVRQRSAGAHRARRVRDVVREPMLALLLGGGVIYLALGDVRSPRRRPRPVRSHGEGIS